MRLNKYCKVFSVSGLHAARNYGALVGLCIFLLICLVIFANLWEVIRVKTGAIDMNRTELLWYIALNQWVLVSLPRVEREIQMDFRSGKLAYLLPRPMSYLGFVFAEGLGVFCVNLFVLGVVTFGVTYWLVGAMPVALMFWPVIVGLSLMAGCLGIVFQMMMGLCAFWMHEVEPLAWIWEKSLFALGGLILPLTIYPPVLMWIARFTPFPYILGGRSSLVLEMGHLGWVLMGLCIWLVVGVIGVCALYRKALKIVNVEGG